MGVLKKIKSLIVKSKSIPLAGPLINTLIAFIRIPQSRSRIIQLLQTTNDMKSSLQAVNTVTGRLTAVNDGYGSAIRGLEQSLKNHGLELEWLKQDSENIRARLEFIRKEVMFELRKELQITGSGKTNSDDPLITKLLSQEKLNNSDILKLNLGCGHLPIPDYINIDSRELPGVDVVADVASLPFADSSVKIIRASHLVEHFSVRTLQDLILPHWFKLLANNGELRIVVPDSDAMLKRYAEQELSFEQLSEVIFGGQEYSGDFHYSMFNSRTLANLLVLVGFSQVDLIATDRKNGSCYELEVCAKKITP